MYLAAAMTWRHASLAAIELTSSAAANADASAPASPQTLYNGIVLPRVWPPRDLDPASDEPMPVPCLESPPAVIPIDVGRQLFVDDFLIESTTLTRRFHRPEKYTGNPVFRAETPRELAPSTDGDVLGQAATVYTGQGGVFYDPAAERFEMFYVAGWRGPLAMATSRDMIHWDRPDLGIVSENLLLPPGVRWPGEELAASGSDNCVWLDPNAEPAERLKLLTCWTNVPKGKAPKGFSHTLHVSDGRTWTRGVPANASDYTSFFYNPFRDKWVFSIKRNGPRGRSRYYCESDEFLSGADWSDAVYWCNADRLDRPEPDGGYPGAGDAPQLYSLNAVAYESLMIGMFYLHRGPKNDVCEAGQYPKLTDLAIGYSRDGFHWSRPDRRSFIAGSRDEGTWDRAYLHGAAGVFVLLNDQLVFPYVGFSGVAPDGTRGMYTGGSIGIATLRRDGFASMDGGPAGGTLTTRPLRFAGKHLFVNLDAADGELLVELLDAESNVLATSRHTSGDDSKIRIEWDGPADLSEFVGKPVRFRFSLKNGQLYSFWVGAEDGASQGYLGAGGPGYPSRRDR
jgi:hypothetical protein